MKVNPIFVFSLVLLIFIGSAGLWQLKPDSSNHARNGTANELRQPAAANDGARIGNGANTNLETEISSNKLPAETVTSVSAFNDVNALIKQGNLLLAADKISQNYSSLTSPNLELLFEYYLTAAYQLSQNDDTKRLRWLAAIGELYDEPRIWRGIAQSASNLKDWNTAVDAQLSLLQLQSDSLEREQTERELLLSSNQLRAEFEAQGDELSIKDLYQRITRIASNSPRFQLELAFSHARLEETDFARAILEPLVFDQEVGSAATTALAAIEKQLAGEQSAIAQTPTPREPQRPAGIVVPLQPVGTSFLVNTQIERRNTRLLLDTGASITALSSELISQLNLQPLNRQIRLNTANGSTSANLYRVKRLRLGQLELRDLVIADIDLGGATHFQGLLGTDALNQLKQNYDYVIDDRRKALIFRRR